MAPKRRPTKRKATDQGHERQTRAQARAMNDLLPGPSSVSTNQNHNIINQPPPPHIAPVQQARGRSRVRNRGRGRGANIGRGGRQQSVAVPVREVVNADVLDVGVDAEDALQLEIAGDDQRQVAESVTNPPPSVPNQVNQQVQRSAPNQEVNLDSFSGSGSGRGVVGGGFRVQNAAQNAGPSGSGYAPLRHGVVQHSNADHLLQGNAGRAEAQFRFKDEQGWVEDGMLASDAGSKLLSVDVDALTRHIKAIPLPERLGISRLLFEEDVLKRLDKDAEQNATNTNSSHVTNHQQNFTECVTLLPKNSNIDEARIAEPASGLSMKEATEQRQTKQLERLKSSLSTTVADVISSSTVTVTDKIKGECNSADLIVNDSRTSKPKDVRIETDNNIQDQDGEEDELDFLLSLENPVQVKGQSAVTKDAEDVGGMEDKAECNKDANNTPTVPQTTDTPVPQTTDTPVPQTTDTPVPQTASQPSSTAMQDGKDDLEDWLDDMLDE